MRLLSIFRRAKQTPALPKPATRDAGDARMARRGATFRTVRMRPEEDVMNTQGEWLQACRQENDKAAWRVLKCTPMKREADTALDEEPVQSTIYREGLGFFDAVALLAEYEVGQLHLGWVAIEDKSALGLRHYEAFAKRERVQFDMAGQPVIEAAPLIVPEFALPGSILEGRQYQFDCFPEPGPIDFDSALKRYRARAQAEIGKQRALRFSIHSKS